MCVRPVCQSSKSQHYTRGVGVFLFSKLLRGVPFPLRACGRLSLGHHRPLGCGGDLLEMERYLISELDHGRKEIDDRGPKRADAEARVSVEERTQ